MSEPSNDGFLVRKIRKFLYKKSDKFCEEDEGYLTARIIGDLRRNGFDITATRRFGFLAYALAGFPDHLPILKWIPFNRVFTRSLILLDEVLAKVPLLRSQSSQIIVRNRKSESKM